MVSTHATTMLPATPQRTADNRRVAPTPMIDDVLLYVDEANTNAIRVYERLGFTRYATDVCWSRGN